MLNMSQSGFVVWFTGLSGSGKSTLASMLAAEIAHRGVHVETLDGDEVRLHLSKGLGFSKEDRDTNIRRIGFVAKLIARAGGCAITAAISPYREIRDEQRRAAGGRFCEIYCSCPIDALAARDAKGLYKKALAGEIKNFTGVDDPYEAPTSPDVVVETDKESKEESLTKIVAKLEQLGFIRRFAGAADPAQTGLRKLALPHGGELIDRWARGAEKTKLAEKAKSLLAVTLDDRAGADVENIAVGAFSPLKGFMTSKDYLRVVREMRLENGLPWSVPVTLAVSRAEAEQIRVGGEIALKMPDGRIVAVMEVSDKFVPDKELEAREIYRTTEDKHPGVAYLKGSGDVSGVPSRSSPDPRALREPRLGHGGRFSNPKPHPPRPRIHHQMRARDLRWLDDSPLGGGDQERRHSRAGAYEMLRSALGEVLPQGPRRTFGLSCSDALRRAARSHLPRHRAEELWLLTFHRGARSRRCGQLLRHLRRAEDLRPVFTERARNHPAQLRERVLLQGGLRHGDGQDGPRRREHPGFSFRDQGARSAARRPIASARVQPARSRANPHRLDEGRLTVPRGRRP
jgi:adenylyl-sulfate kinase